MVGQASDSVGGDGEPSTGPRDPPPLRQALDDGYFTGLWTQFQIINKDEWAASGGSGLIALGDLRSDAAHALCERCRAIRVLGPQCRTAWDHLCLAEMRDNALTCRLCNLLAEALEPSWHPAYPHAMVERSKLSKGDQINREDADVSIAAFAHPQMPDDATYLVAYLSQSGIDHGLCTIKIFKSQASIIPLGGLTLTDYRDRTWTRKMDRIGAWLREDWARWEASTEPFHHGKQFPPRLLDLGAGEGLIDGRPLQFDPDRPVRLIHTRDDARRIRIPNGMLWFPYAVLSHRWGPSTEACRTTTENALGRFREGIKVSSLCQTFQDAIKVALEMGMPYLWIDSLCILQDDEDDWKHQSAYMDDIYMNALLTIAAHSFPDPNDGGSGFLELACASEGADPIPLGTIPSTSISTTSLYARHDQMFEVAIYNSPLSSRGWILQERLLSPRIIHFFPSQLYYESRLFGIVRAEDRTPALLDPDQLREAVFRTDNVSGATPLDWFRVVERYSACRLTQPSDKLIAVSGIAKHFQKTSGEKYLAGLWWDRAAKGLLWLARGPNLTRVKGRAPSWSWASVDGPVRYPSLLLRRPFRVLPVLQVVAAIGNVLEEPKHIMGQSDNIRALEVVACVRRAVVSDEWVKNRDTLLSAFYPLGMKFEERDGQVPLDLDEVGVYREVRDEEGRAVGWVSLDEDEGGECPLAGAELYTAIVASEGAWVRRDDLGDVLYCTHPHTAEYDAFYATGVVEATFTSPTFDSPPDASGADGRELIMTYWALLLQPEDPSAVSSPLAKFARVGFAQIMDRRWQRSDDWRMLQLV